jgi:hypothetical protein
MESRDPESSGITLQAAWSSETTAVRPLTGEVVVRVTMQLGSKARQTKTPPSWERSPQELIRR